PENQQHQTYCLEQIALEPPIEAMTEEECVAAEATTHGCNHSLRAAVGDRNVGGDGVVPVQNAGSIADGNAGIHTCISEIGSPRDCAWFRCQQAHEARIIQREDLVLPSLFQEQRL